MTLAYDNPKDFLKHTDKRVLDKIKTYLPPSLLKNGPKFITYLINSPKSMAILLKDSYYATPLPSRFLQSHFDALYKMKDEGIEQMYHLDIIMRSNYQRATDTKAGLCREFNINPQILLDLLIYANKLDTHLHAAALTKNPVTNQEVAPPSISLNPSSPLYSVMSYHYHNVVSIKDIEKYCSDRYEDLLRRKDKLLKKNPRQYESEVKSIASDYQKYISLVLRGQQDKQNVFQYQKQFLLTSTGRVCEVGGGLQGLSRGCKAFIYKDKPHVMNYDIRGCQLALLGHYAKGLGINTQWIDDYVRADNNKTLYARAVGISVAAWKKSILSMVFGGSDSRFGTPYQTILKDKGGNVQRADDCFNKWKQETEGLRAICKLWLTKIRKFAKSMAKNNMLENAVGVQINLKDKLFTRKFLSSFLLQGLESRIISDLILFEQTDYQVISPEYDGLVVSGKIKTEVWESVIRNLGLDINNLILESKSFN